MVIAPQLHSKKASFSISNYSQKEPIPLLETGFWQIESGVVQLETVHNNEKKVILGWAKPKTFFGKFLSGSPNDYASACGEVCLKFYPLKAIESESFLLPEILVATAEQMRQTKALLAISGLSLVEQRLQKLLILLSEEIGEPSPGGIRLSIHLTHRTIASAIATTRVTVTKLLGEFQRLGFIQYDRQRHLIIRDIIDY